MSGDVLKPRRLKSFRRPILEDDSNGEKRMLCRFHINGCPFSFKLDRGLPESKARRKGTSACWNHEERDCDWNEDKLATVPKPKKTRNRDDYDDDDDASVTDYSRRKRVSMPRATRATKSSVNFREESSDENVYEYDEEEPMEEEEYDEDMAGDKMGHIGKSPRIKTSLYSMPPTPPNSMGPSPHGGLAEMDLIHAEANEPGVRSLLLSADDNTYVERMTMAIQNVERKLDRFAAAVTRRIGLLETRMVSIESEIQNVTEGQYSRDRRIEDLVNLTRGVHGVCMSTATGIAEMRGHEHESHDESSVVVECMNKQDQLAATATDAVPATTEPATAETIITVEKTSTASTMAPVQPEKCLAPPPPTVASAHPTLPDLTPEVFEEAVQSSFQVAPPVDSNLA